MMKSYSTVCNVAGKVGKYDIMGRKLKLNGYRWGNYLNQRIDAGVYAKKVIPMFWEVGFLITKFSFSDELKMVSIPCRDR